MHVWTTFCWKRGLFIRLVVAVIQWWLHQCGIWWRLTDAHISGSLIAIVHISCIWCSLKWEWVELHASKIVLQEAEKHLHNEMKSLLICECVDECFLWFSCWLCLDEFVYWAEGLLLAAPIVKSPVCARTIRIVCGCRCWLVCRFDCNEVLGDP